MGGGFIAGVQALSAFFTATAVRKILGTVLLDPRLVALRAVRRRRPR